MVRRIDSEKNINILLIDERGEFSMVKGENIDVIKFGSKKDSFLLGVRSLSPDLVVMDELATVDDFINVEYASSCGIKVIATVHGSDKESLIKKHYYKKGLFDKYVFLKGGDKKGVIDKITDMDFNEI